LAAEPGFPPRLLKILGRIGKDDFDTRLLMASSPGATLLKRLPGREQKRCLDRPVDMVVMRGDQVDTIRVPIHEMEVRQAKQVFAKDHVRSHDEQKQWLLERERKTTTETAATLPPYEIRDRNKVFFRSNTILTAGDLARILAELTSTYE